MGESGTVKHPDHVYAADVDSGGVHNCRRCNRLVIWGVTKKGNRAEFDYPASDDGYVNHHIICPMSPGKTRTGGLLEPSDAPGGCADCRESILRGGMLCAADWRRFRAWMSSLKPDAYTIWQHGERQDRRRLLEEWRRQVAGEAVPC